MEPVKVFRCKSCRRAFTERKVFSQKGCGCGNRHFAPTNPLWYEYPKIYLEYFKYYRKEK